MDCLCGNGQQIPRTVKRGKRAGDVFWGCSSFPKCRITYSVDPNTIIESSHKPSPHQQAAMDAFYEGNNVIVRATAGSGKSTTIKQTIRDNPEDGNTLVLVFNATPRKLLRDALPMADVHTFNSFGGQILRDNGYYTKVNDRRFWQFFRNFLVNKNATAREKAMAYVEIERLIELLSYLKGDLILPQDMTRDYFENFLVERNIRVPSQESIGNWHTWLRAALEYTLADPSEITFQDQLYLPLVWQLYAKTEYDFIFVDEFQDANPNNQALVMAHASPETRLFLVGDENQSIYQWRDAAPDTMVKAEGHYGCTALPLPVSFRNSVEVTKLVNNLFPSIDHQHLPDAPEGKVVRLNSPNRIPQYIKGGDMVVGYANFPLVDLAWHLISEGYNNVRFTGRDESWRIKKYLKPVLDLGRMEAEVAIDKAIQQEIDLAVDVGKSDGYVQRIRESAKVVYYLLDITNNTREAYNFIKLKKGKM